MKNLFYLFLISFFTFSCEKDESLDPRPLEVQGQFVRLDITNKVLDILKLNEVTFGGLLTSPANNVASYEIFVRRETNDVVTGNYVKLLTINSFPSNLEITPQMLADALSIDVSTFIQGDIFRFRAFSYDFKGNKIDYNNLSSVIKSQKTMKQGYRFTTQIFQTASYSLPGFLDNYNNYIP